MTERWEFWIDRGGTFTDCIGLEPNTRRLHVAKVLSSDDAPLQAIRILLGLDEAATIPPCDLRMGTTVATNALLERKGTPHLLLITRGFGDLLEIGTQARPHIFELQISKPAPLYRAVLETDARADPSGRILSRPDPGETVASLKSWSDRGLVSVAVVVAHSYACPDPELELGRLAEKAGFRYVALSHEVAPELGMLARGDTTSIDAYLTPLIRDYLKGLLEHLPESSIEVMQSSGGLTDAAHFRGPNAILSGPAAGVVACREVARNAGVARVIGFDMGGTSVDVSRYDGEFERVYETEIAGVRLRAPMLNIHTVASGGGSLCRYDGYRLVVGPESAGAVPGPLCYGNPEASELTLTDVNLVLGRIQPDRFPFPMDHHRPRAALEALATKLLDPAYQNVEAIAQGFFEIANHNMAEAIRHVSVARGYDVREYALVVFGGAGGQHACRIAELLGITTILCHPFAGVLSAYGMGLADVSWHGEADAGRHRLDEKELSLLQAKFSTLQQTGLRALMDQGYRQEQLSVTRHLDLAYQGTETSLTLPAQSAVELSRAFEIAHERRFGYARPGHEIQVVQARVEVMAAHRPIDSKALTGQNPKSNAPERVTRLWYGRGWLEQVPVYQRESLYPTQHVSGPAIILEATGTLVVDPGFSLEVADDGLLVLRREALAERPALVSHVSGGEADPVLLEIMGNLYMSIAEQMGHVLRRTALSTNIRERLDFSCAIFDAEARLVANAPHIPVHLGAMGESVRAVCAAHPQMRPGDAYVTNDPAAGGSHLPDITLVTPVFDAAGALLFFTASRGHHADVGGISPGSMPAFSQSLEEEGIVLRGLRIVRSGRFDREGVLAALRSGPYPARRPEENLADLQAQLAANRLGAGLLLKLVDDYGLEVVRSYMRHLQGNARAKVAEQIERLPDGEHTFSDYLDDGTPVRVLLRVSGDRLIVDFSGTGVEVEGNLNAPRAVTVAAVIYFLRTLVGEPIPLNAGCLEPVEIRIPPGSLLAPAPNRAVAGGNVETSQRIVDVLLAAAGKAAASQGTMNNLSFGDASFAYYETIAGGAGAGPGFSGASAVHTHMTNTRITDPEVLESRFPVRVIEFSIRRGSGGDGKWSGGDGICRTFEFLRKVQVSMLSERRTRPPFGLAGGCPGSPGINRIDGQEVGGNFSCEVVPGQHLRIETPGGGGYGAR